jgi:hypothetical protein
MQPLRELRDTLERLAEPERYLFKANDFRCLFPGMKDEALRVLLDRAQKNGLLEHFCRGIYLYPKITRRRGYELYHAAARLRSDTLCYLSLESVLSELGIISQIPIGWITLETQGRSGIIKCGKWGNIEFIHTEKLFDSIAGHLSYDSRIHLWRADAELALEDMKHAKRPMDLVNQEEV